MRRVFCLIFLMGLALFCTGFAVSQEMSFSSGPQYLLTNGSPMFARSIGTPIMSLPAPAPAVGATDSTAGLDAGAENATVMPQVPAAADLLPIFYGRDWVNEIRMSAPPQDLELPASLLEDGVMQVTTVQALARRGYGLTLAQAAAQGRAQTRHGGRVYTNEDAERLRKSN